MYQTHFGLSDMPFGLTPNTGFYYGLPPHEEALQVLRVALTSGEGFIKVTGEVGTGKTLLLRKFLNELPEHYQAAYLPNPCLEAEELRQALATELGIAEPRHTLNLTDAIHHRLVELCQQGKQVVLLLDEAQALSDAALEAVRLFGNLETESSKLLQVILFGQPELDQRLAQSNLRQLRQRISFSYRLRPLLPAETCAYLAYRLQVSGYKGMPLFHGMTLRLLWQASRGIPRLINILAHKCLMQAYGRQQRQIRWRDVFRAAQDTEDASAPVAWLGWGTVLILTGVVLAGIWSRWG
ncbi:ExeA family protein [Tolumonas lignilytica]|uniref:ExeA family protein n=1 Tax=Tolumonas lignilytica TaxID=1283284 RepID=UPI0004641CFD|nr:AAA family ATPase [Tolumonas lignilytica]